MPYAGIPAGSQLERKVERCVERVTATGRDKSTAIAICRAAIAGASSTKAREDAVRAARYRNAGPANLQICATCKNGANEFNYCDLFEFTYDPNWTCDRWLPNIDAARERLQALRAENEARLAQRAEWVEVAKLVLMIKRGATATPESEE